jgi:hypothetical protein
MREINKVRGCLLALAMLAAVPAGFGQAVYGSIFGTVVDSSGAFIPGATIVVTDSAKGTSTTYTSNSNGEFTADHLLPDPYNHLHRLQGLPDAEPARLGRHLAQA